MSSRNLSNLAYLDGTPFEFQNSDTLLKFRRPALRARVCADVVRRAATRALWRVPGVFGRGGAVGGRAAARGGVMPHADHAGRAHFHAIAEGAAAAAEHCRAGAHGPPARLPDLRGERQLRVADGGGESRDSADALSGGPEPSRSQEGPVASVHDVRPVEVHQLLALRARVRRGAGAVCALDARAGV